MYYLLLFRFSLFPSFEKSAENENRNRKTAFFAVICPFLSQIKRWFSVFYRYIGQITPHPPRFWHSQGGSALVRKFFIFYFLFFCKILWFYQFSFSTEFWAFLRTSYLLFFLHKVSWYLLLLISVRQVAFYAASW